MKQFLSQLKHNPWSTFSLLAFVITLCWLPIHHSAAQNSSKLERALAKAQKAYDELEFEDAELLLEGAIGRAKQQGLDQDPTTARLYIFLGIIRFSTTGEPEAEQAFIEALTIDPSAEIDPDYRTPNLDKVFERARGQAGGGFPPDTGTGFPPDTGTGFPPDTGGPPSLQHTPVRTANAGRPLRFEAQIPQTLPVYRVVLHYRRFGERNFSTLDMRPVGRSSFVVDLDGRQVDSSQMDYFIEALDRTGGILIAAGGPSSPLQITVFGGSNNFSSPEPDPEPDGDSGERQYVFISLTASTGLGLATGTPDAVRFPQFANINVDAGIAPSPFSANAELGVMITPAVHISGFFRLQIPEITMLGGAKLRYWFENEGDFRLNVGIGGGFGEVSHIVDLRPAADFTSFTKEGPIHVGVPFGAIFGLSENFALVLDLYAMALFPVFSIHGDLHLGIRASF